RYVVYDAPNVRPHVDLHPEVPLVPLLRLPHLGIALALLILRRTRGLDDSGIHYGPGPEQEALLLQQFPDFGEHRLGQVVPLQEVTEAEDRGLVGHGVLAQLDAHEAPHGLAVVDGVLGLGIGEVEPLLQEVDAEHLLEAQGRPSLALLRVVWFDESDEPLPWDDSVHLGEEPLAASDLALGVPCQSGERPLLSHALSSLEVRVRCQCLTNITHQTRVVQRFPRSETGNRRLPEDAAPPSVLPQPLHM